MIKKLFFLAISTQITVALYARPTGLANCGNTCYLNAVTQSLYNIKPLTGFLSKDANNIEEIHTFPGAYQQLIRELPIKTKIEEEDPTLQGYTEASMAIIAELADTNPYAQEDAQEFLTGAFNSLKRVSRSFDIYISNLLGIFQTTKTRCPLPEGDELIAFYDEDPIFYLSVPIKTPPNPRKKISAKSLTTLEDSLNEYFKKEIQDDPKNYYKYQGTNPAYNAYRGAEIPNCERQIQLVTTPELLVISLNRYEYTNFGATRSKLTHAVTIPSFINIRPFMKIPEEKNDYIYSLISVIVHRGGTGGGHYVAYIKDANKWYLCDDSRITEQSPTNVQNEINKNGYVFFYQKNELSESSSLKLLQPSKSEEKLKQELTNLSNRLDLLEKELQKPK